MTASVRADSFAADAWETRWASLLYVKGRVLGPAWQEEGRALRVQTEPLHVGVQAEDRPPGPSASENASSAPPREAGGGFRASVASAHEAFLPFLGFGAPGSQLSRKTVPHCRRPAPGPAPPAAERLPLSLFKRVALGVAPAHQTVIHTAVGAGETTGDNVPRPGPHGVGS